MAGSGIRILVTNEIRVKVSSDVDMVPARQKGRELAERMGFSRTDATLIATAISEVARNIIVHVGCGEIILSSSREQEGDCITVVARDWGPGIADVAAAMEHGQSERGSLGLGLPGSRRLMDEFAIESEVGMGTTVTMKKWKPSGVSHG
jgi:serine/threonine-protein kinase RsbT